MKEDFRCTVTTVTLRGLYVVKNNLLLGDPVLRNTCFTTFMKDYILVIHLI